MLQVPCELELADHSQAHEGEIADLRFEII